MKQPSNATNIQDLLVHAEWLRGLANHLLRDGEADDAVQDTWLAASRSAPRNDADRSRPWLAAVLRNFARRRWRTRRIHEDHEPVATEEAADSPEQLLERAQTQRLLAELVVKLEEPYRSAILLRYYEGRSAADIARQLELPAGTVRWRLKEGIDRLRARLDAHHDGDRRAWALLLTPPAGPRVPRPRPRPPLLPAATALLGILSVVAVVGATRWRGKGTRPVPAEASLKQRAARLLAAETASGWREARIEGEVKTPDGRPASGAVVSVSRITGSGAAPTTHASAFGVARTDGAGRFSVIATSNGRYLVSASVVGFVPASSASFILAPSEHKRLVLTLGRGGVTMTGTILDEGGGPIPGARVTARVSVAGAPVSQSTPDRLMLTVADEAGRYQLTVAPREYAVCGEADGYAPFERTVSLTRDLRQNFTLQPAARVRGRVVDVGGGQPIASAAVFLDPPSRREPGSSRRAITSEDGTFSFEDLEAGRYTVRVRRSQSDVITQPLALVPAQLVDLGDVKLPTSGPGTTLAGRVVDDSGRGVSGLGVWMESLSATTDSDGRFALHGVLPGRQTVNVAAATGWLAKHQEVTIPTSGLPNLELVAVRGAVIEGRVLSSVGTPVAAALISPVGMPWGSSVESGPDGSYRLGVASDTASVTAWHPSEGVTTEGIGPLSPGQTQHLDLRLESGVSISGTVAYEDGTPAAAISVAATGQDGESLRRYASVSTGDDGRFLVSGLLPGRYTVKARRLAAPWNLSTSRETPDLRIVQVPAGQGVAGVSLVLAKGGHRIAGSVRLADGQPASGTTILANVEDGGRSWKPLLHSVDYRTMSHADGTFTLDDVEAGTFSIWAMRPDIPEVRLTGIAADRSDVQIRLPAAASVAGIVTDSAGRPLANYSLNVVPVGGDGPDARRQRDEAGLLVRSISNALGSFDWGGLTAGAYEIKVMGSDGSGANQTITLKEGQRLTDLHLSLASGVIARGRALDLETGVPVGGLRVAGRFPGHNLFAMTEADGSFELRGLLPGEAGTVEVRSDDYVLEQLEVVVSGSASPVDIGVIRPLRASDWSVRFRDPGVTGVHPRRQNGHLMVGEMRDGTPGQRAGLLPTDRLLAIDGHDLRDAGPGAAAYWLSQPVGHVVKLTIERAGAEPRTVALTTVKSASSVPRSR